MVHDQRFALGVHYLAVLEPALELRGLGLVLPARAAGHHLAVSDRGLSFALCLLTLALAVLDHRQAQRRAHGPEVLDNQVGLEARLHAHALDRLERGGDRVAQSGDQALDDAAGLALRCGRADLGEDRGQEVGVLEGVAQQVGRQLSHVGALAVVGAEHRTAFGIHLARQDGRDGAVGHRVIHLEQVHQLMAQYGHGRHLGVRVDVDVAVVARAHKAVDLERAGLEEHHLLAEDARDLAQHFGQPGLVGQALDNGVAVGLAIRLDLAGVAVALGGEQRPGGVLAAVLHLQVEQPSASLRLATDLCQVVQGVDVLVLASDYVFAGRLLERVARSASTFAAICIACRLGFLPGSAFIFSASAVKAAASTAFFDGLLGEGFGLLVVVIFGSVFGGLCRALQQRLAVDSVGFCQVEQRGDLRLEVLAGPAQLRHGLHIFGHDGLRRPLVHGLGSFFALGFQVVLVARLRLGFGDPVPAFGRVLRVAAQRALDQVACLVVVVALQVAGFAQDLHRAVHRHAGLTEQPHRPDAYVAFDAEIRLLAFGQTAA